MVCGVGSDSFGHYELRGVLGRGGMGQGVVGNFEEGMPAKPVTINSVQIG